MTSEQNQAIYRHFVDEVINNDDGKIVERFGSFDALGMMQQLGLVPAPGGGH